MQRKNAKEKIYSTLHGVLRRGNLTSILAHYKLAREGYLVKYGWFDAFAAGSPVDGQGDPLPWLVYPVIDLLEERSKPHFRVFEYGSGASSRWWASRVQQVTSVEHDRGWYERGTTLAPSNLRLLHRDGKDYPAAITEQPTSFHVVVIDGRWRCESATASVQCLTDDGVMIWDNSERERYADTQTELRAKGFKQLRFRGMAPSSVALQETSIFYRQENCLGL